MTTSVNNNWFEDRMASLNELDRILMTDTLTIAQFIANRRKYLLRNREALMKDKIIGLMNSASAQVIAAAKLVNVIRINNKNELNQKQYLDGLCIKHIDEIATKLHRFTHNESNCAIFLWQFTLYSVINPDLIITHKNPSKMSVYCNIWRCNNKLIIKRNPNASRSNTSNSAIFYCYAQLIPLTASMPTFNLTASPFVIGRRCNINGKQIWPKSIRNAISAKHATITHNFGENTTKFQRNSKVNDMTINDTDPVLDINEMASLRHNDRIEIISGVIYVFKLLQKVPWAQNVPHFLLQNPSKKSRKNVNINEFARNRDRELTPPPPRIKHRQNIRRHQSPPIQNNRINRRLNFSGDYIDLTQNDDGLMISRLPLRNNNNNNNNNDGIPASPSPPAMSQTQTQRIHINQDRNSRKRRERNYIPETNLKDRIQQSRDDRVDEPSTKRMRQSHYNHINDDEITKTPLKMRNSYDLKHIDSMNWISHRLLVFARYCLNPEIQCLNGAKITPKTLPHGALLHIKKKMKGTALVFHREVGSLLTRHAHIQSFLESILILHGGKCNLNIEYLALNGNENGINVNKYKFPGIICDEIKIGNMGSGYCILIIFVVEKASSMMTHNGLCRLLVKLEQLDRELCSNRINIKYLYGIITDGTQWNIVRRKNKQRYIAKDVLNDHLLLNHSIGSKDGNKDNTSKFNQIAASLAQERWQLFKSRYDDDYGSIQENTLYDGYVLQCDICRCSSNKLQEISRVIHGLIYEQRMAFDEAFKIALRHNSELNRPAINPYHSVNKNEQQKQCNEYLSLCDKVYNVRDDFQQHLTQNDW